MEGILVFDQTNDLIYQNLNQKMKEKMMKHGIKAGLLPENFESVAEIDSNVLIQIFSPLITSQRIMLCQFDNSYTSIEMENDLNIVFEEFLGYLFLQISTKEVDLMKRELGVFICFIKHFCGPIIYTIKSDHQKNILISNIHKCWNKMYITNQSILVEAIEQLLVNTEVKNSVVNTLQAATEKLKQDPHSQRSHSIMFVNNKFLALYSSRQAQSLSAIDLLFLNVFCQTLNSQEMKKTASHIIFLQGNPNNAQSGCIPHIIHVSKLYENIFLILLIEYGNLNVSNGLYDVFYALQKLQNLQMQFDTDNLRTAFDSLESCVKHTVEAIKKTKYNNAEVDEMVKNFTNKWDILKKKYLEFFKVSDKDLIVKIESNMPSFLDAVKDLFRVLYASCSTLEHGLQRVSDITNTVQDRLKEIADFLQVKSQKNFTMGSYLDDFPGLVHFLHIDRSSGRIVAPGLDEEEKDNLVKEKVWEMVELSRSYLHKGHMSVIWKDVAFCYSYFMWFEDINGTPLKPKEFSNLTTTTTKPQLMAGILAGDYYQRIIETCFPKTNPNRIKCYEIYCVHLGLVTASCVLEHCRRLAATITDVTGCVGNPLDLL